MHSLLGRLGLLGTDRLPTWKTAIVLALLAWVPPMVLALLQSLLREGYQGWLYFQDLTVYTRYLVAIIAMVITERLADRRIRMLLNHFPDSGILEPQAQGDFAEIVRRADRRVSMPAVEVVLLILAVFWSWASFYYVATISVSGWEEWGTAAESHMSWAGITAELLSNPIFLFLVLRWTWRFLVWTLLLWQISRLSLRFIAIHPDRAGGLGFLSLFPGIFIGLVFGLSCVVASSLLKTMALINPSQLFIWLAIGAWVVLMMLIFFAPLTLFSGALAAKRQTGLIEYGKLVQEHHRLFDERWVHAQHSTREFLGSSDPSSVADLNAAYETLQQMRIVPLDLSSVLQLLLAALLPFLLVVLSMIPLSDLLQWLLGAIL